MQGSAVVGLCSGDVQCSAVHAVVHQQAPCQLPPARAVLGSAPALGLGAPALGAPAGRKCHSTLGIFLHHQKGAIHLFF